MKIREMESKLELELTTRGRLDTQIARWEQIFITLLFFWSFFGFHDFLVLNIAVSRLKEMIEKLTREGEDARMREQSSQVGRMSC